MLIPILAFVIGVVSGLRALTGLAVLSWAARLHRVAVEDTIFAFFGYTFTPYILTAMALGEIVNDKLPKTPSRTIPPQFITRLVTGALCGAVVGAAAKMLFPGLVAGLLGAAAGTLGGAKARGFLARAFGKDLPAALLEDCIAMALAVLVCFFSAVLGDAKQAISPSYSASTIAPVGSTAPAPLAPGMVMSIYGERLGPQIACNGSADPHRTESPNPRRPNQTLVEIQVFPKNLCDAEVKVAGIPAGLVYVQANQINFKVPQDIAVQGTAKVQVFYKGQPGPLVTEALSPRANLESSQALAETIWNGLTTVQWQAPYRAQAADKCSAVPAHPDLRGGLYGYAFFCAHSDSGVVAESFYYPENPVRPAILLRRADFRLAAPYPAMSAEVEHLLKQRLTRVYGTGLVPEHFFEIGANLPDPGWSWRAGAVTVFLHRNRIYTAPAGVHEGVTLIAVRREVLDEREELIGIQRALAASLPALQFAPASERQTAANLTRLLRHIDTGDRNVRAEKLVAADELAVRLGKLLVSEPDASRVRRQLVSLGVHYTGPGHYSGDLEYDRVFLRRAWREFPETPWGQRAFLMLQRLSCSTSTVIRQGESFLSTYPQTTFRKEQIYHLGLAHETRWSLAQAVPGDPTAEGAHIDSASAERARKQAIDLYEELFRIAPHSPEARAGQLVLPRLKLRLGTGERAFFCFSD